MDFIITALLLSSNINKGKMCVNVLSFIVGLITISAVIVSFGRSNAIYIIIINTSRVSYVIVLFFFLLFLLHRWFGFHWTMVKDNAYGNRIICTKYFVQFIIRVSNEIFWISAMKYWLAVIFHSIYGGTQMVFELCLDVVWLLFIVHFGKLKFVFFSILNKRKRAPLFKPNRKCICNWLKEKAYAI